MATGGYTQPDTQPMMQGYGGQMGGGYQPQTNPHMQAGGMGGGYTNDPHGHMPAASTADPYGGQYTTAGHPMGGMQGVDKSLQWRLAFFLGALATLAAGVISSSYFVFHCFQASTWSPATFISALCLTFFGLMMVVVDLPMKLQDVSGPARAVMVFRDGVFSFALFMTRFSGRGFWYLFLGSHCWVALYDDNIAGFIGIIFTTYLAVVGVAALYKGFTLSKRLHDVQQKMQLNQVSPERFLQPGANGVHIITKEGFQSMVQQAYGATGDNLFSEEETVYIINALSFRADHDNDLSLEEIQYWLKPSGSSFQVFTLV
jgi:hypothetical protein